MALILAEILNAQVLSEILVQGKPVEDVVDELFTKGAELAGCISSRTYTSWAEFKGEHAASHSELVQLEGQSTIGDSDVVVLLKCPMADTMKELNANGPPPAHHQTIIDGYMAQNPGANALLHPGCIAHQVARQLAVKMLQVRDTKNVNYYQLACRSGAASKVVYDDNGMKAIGMTREQADAIVADKACLYVMVRS